MDAKIIVAGFGGQGVLSLGQLITYAAMEEGKEVTWLPSYGPEMRGGTANCSVVVSNKPIASPVITSPNALLVFNKPSLIKFEKNVAPNGILLINSSLIETKTERKDVRVAYIDTLKIAAEIGEPRVANMVMLGAYIKMSGIVSKASVESVIEDKFAHKPKVIPLNKLALEAGYNLV